MTMIRRKKSPIIDRFLPLCATCHLVLEMDSDSSVDSFVSFLKNTVYALRIRKRGSFIERHNDIDKIPSYTFPQNINNSFSSLNDVSNYVHENIPLNFDDGYAVIASSPKNCSRKFVALNTPHYFADGKYFCFLTDMFLHNNPNNNNLNGLPDFPYENPVIYKEFFDKGPSDVKNDIHDDKLTRFSTNDPNNLKGGEFDQYITIQFKAEELKNKTIRNNKIFISNFTEALYLSNYFAICAHENKLLPSYGVNNVIDLKKYFPKPISFANSSEIAFVSPYTDYITPDMKNIEVGKSLRKSLMEKLNRNEQYGFYNSMKYNESLPKLNGIITEFSNIGGIHIKKPIKDLWISLFIKCMNRETVSNMGFSVIRDDFDSYTKEDRINRSKNDMILRYRYSPRKLSVNESTKIAKTIEYFLKNVSLDDCVGKTYEEVKRFYNSL